MSKTKEYVYVLKTKETEVVIQDIFLSRQEARETKRLYESRDGEKYNIVRFKIDKSVR